MRSNGGAASILTIANDIQRGLDAIGIALLTSPVGPGDDPEMCEALTMLFRSLGIVDADIDRVLDRMHGHEPQ